MTLLHKMLLILILILNGEVALGCGVFVVPRMFHTLDVLRRLNLFLPDESARIHCLTPIDVSRVLLLKQFRDLTGVHAVCVLL